MLNGSLRVFNPAGRYLNFNYYFQYFKYHILNVYVPAVSSQLSVLFRNLEPFLLWIHECILAGDFHCVIYSYADVQGVDQHGVLGRFDG